MSNLSLVLLAMAGVFTLCVLLVLFMVANDRPSEQPAWFKRFRSLTASFGFGVLLFLWAAFLCRIAFEAEQRHTVIPPTRRTAWMSPQQGYAAALLLFLAASYSIFLSLRERRNRLHNAPRRT
jgi:peptidoglycan/LPS O-acetylase OafA/YrhL